MKRRTVLLLMVMTVALLTGIAPASAVDFFHIFNVNSTGDEPDASAGNNTCATSGGACTLRAAIDEANANDARGDTITFNIPATDPNCNANSKVCIITLSNGQLGIIDDNDTPATDDLIIQGPGARTLTVSGNNASRVFRIEDNANATVSGLTITNGNSSPDLFGGGILNSGGTLTLANSTVSGNTAPHGGGIQNSSGSTLTLVNSTLSGNAATGTNTSPGEGGGIRDFSGSVTLTNSTVSGNAASNGGGIYTNDGFVTLTNSTVSANVATGSGGGIVGVDLGEVTLSNTIVASNSAPNNPNAGGSFNSQGNNLIGNTVDPLLGSLQNNGGPTNTHALLQGSPAIDAGNNTVCPATDQRGETRPKDGDGNNSVICDIGAFELVNSAPVARANSYSVKEDRVLRVGPRGVLANDSDANGDPLSARKVTNTRHGTLTLRADGSLVYNSDKNFNGRDTFYYRAFDGKARSNKAKVTIRVRAVAG